MFVENLRQLGLGEKEISVYLALISTGPVPVRGLAQKAGVNRGTTYDILKALMDEGLVSYYKQYNRSDKKQYFIAEPPQKLLEAVENKKRGLETLKLELKKSLPEIESLYEKSGAKPVAKYYEGSSGLRVILQDVLGSFPSPGDGEGSRERSYYVYSSADIKEYLYKAYPDFNDDRIKAGIRNQVIAFEQGGELAGLDERKCLSKVHDAPTYMLIYNGKVAMISLSGSGQPVGVIMEDMGLYQTQKIIFEFVWSKL